MRTGPEAPNAAVFGNRPEGLVRAFLFAVALLAARPAQAVELNVEENETFVSSEGMCAPAQWVDKGIHSYPSRFVRDLASRVESGQATMPEIRNLRDARRLLYPYDREIPSNWRIDALRQMGALPVSPAPNSTTYTWTSLGPSGIPDGTDTDSGRATSVVFDPANANILYLGTASGGVWKTSDGGLTWAPIFDGNASIAIGCLAMDPNNSSVLYAGTGEGNFSQGEVSGIGIYKSTNSGSTWTLQTLPWAYPLPEHTLRRIVVDPRDSNRVYAAGDGGLYYSTNAGAAWSLTTCGASGSVYGTDIVLDNVSPTVGSPSIAYAAFGYPWVGAASGIYRSTAGPGGPWATVSGSGTGFPTSGVGRIVLVRSPSDPKQVYALVSDTATGGMLGVWYCANISSASVTWTAESNNNYCNGQCFFNLHGVVEAADPARIFLGGLEINHSKNNGSTFSVKSNGSGTGTNYEHVDQHFLTMPNSTTLLAAGDGGLFVGTISGSSNISVSWQNRNPGLGTLQLESISSHPTNTSLYMGGTTDNGLPYFNGSVWSEIWHGDGVDTAWDQTLANYGYVTHIAATVQRNSTITTNPTSWTCIRNFGGCTTCSLTCRPDGGRTDVSPIVLDSNDQNKMFVGSYRIYRNSAVRTTSNWTALVGDSPGGDLTNGGVLVSIHSAKNNGVSGTLYTGSHDGKVFMTANEGTNWFDRTAGLPNAWVEGFATHPQFGSRVLVVLGGFGHGHVYRSTNSGQTWVDLSATLPDMPMNDIVIDPNTQNTAYLGGEMGVFVNTDVWNSSTWVNITANLPPVKVSQLRFQGTSGPLRMATYGRGIYQLQVTTSSATPREATSLLPVRAAGTAISGTFTAGCGATGHTVYAGNLDLLPVSGVSWSSRFCNAGAGPSLNFDPGAGNRYFVVVANDGTLEGSYGSGTGGELPAAGAGAGCSYTQTLVGSCP